MEKIYTRFFQKTTLKLTPIVPGSTVSENEWVDDVAVWPRVGYGCIYSSLIERTGEFTKEKLKAFKSLEAYNYYSR